MRLIAGAGFNCVDLGLNTYLPAKTIRAGAVEGEFALPTEVFLDKCVRPIKEAGEKHKVGFGQAHAPFPSWTPDSAEMNGFLMRSFEMCLEACKCCWKKCSPGATANLLRPPARTCTTPAGTWMT